MGERTRASILQYSPPKQAQRMWHKDHNNGQQLWSILLKKDTGNNVFVPISIGRCMQTYFFENANTGASIVPIM